MKRGRQRGDFEEDKRMERTDTMGRDTREREKYDEEEDRYDEEDVKSDFTCTAPAQRKNVKEEKRAKTED